MGIFTKREIVLYPFPYTDLSQRKLRPCLVISDIMGQDLILCQITSQKTPKDTYAISLTKEDTAKGYLHIDSYVRSNMLFTASSAQLQGKICDISEDKYNEVIHKIIEIITL
ncbi:type II toxin-antitoxin system PemK/MazF family toxin [Candidatus Woesearchaeota archaeon]|nr:type II toxin-antitoxin system PemK/MazF family toxin [Candidatus Woesearchaeota archaeon]